MAYKGGKRRKGFRILLPSVFRHKQNKTWTGNSDPPESYEGKFPATIGQENPLKPTDDLGEVPTWPAPATPLFMESYSGNESGSGVGGPNCSKLSCVVPNISETTKNFRIFVSTWNVGGRCPRVGLDVINFLPADDQTDIYIFGFQEIVPLNAGSVCVIEDNEPAIKWLHLIDRALNKPLEAEGHASPYTPSYTVSDTSSHALGTKSSVYRNSNMTSGLFFQKPSLKAVSKTFRTVPGRRLKTCNCLSEVVRKSYRDSCFRCPQSFTSQNYSTDEEEDEPSFSGTSPATSATNKELRYSLITSKQMVGIFVTVWVKRKHAQHIGHLRLDTVRCGYMKYLPNKGGVAVSMSLHQTSFCFVCCHLASGEKEGDELRRNSDVFEILNTHFPRICRAPNPRIPEIIIEHDRVIWLGDLNYRLAMSYGETTNLLNDNNWGALLEKDQLKIEKEAGRVFKGWNEGKINFGPTYKYSDNSDAYAGETEMSKTKRRTPAWCDRILWHGDGIVQQSYIRGESRFSDHRPVCAAFQVEVVVPESRLRNGLLSPNMKVGAEEILSQSSMCV